VRVRRTAITALAIVMTAEPEALLTLTAQQTATLLSLIVLVMAIALSYFVTAMVIDPVLIVSMEMYYYKL
jgi:hypothetical protein